VADALTKKLTDEAARLMGGFNSHEGLNVSIQPDGGFWIGYRKDF